MVLRVRSNCRRTPFSAAGRKSAINSWSNATRPENLPTAVAMGEHVWKAYRWISAPREQMGPSCKFRRKAPIWTRAAQILPIPRLDNDSTCFVAMLVLRAFSGFADGDPAEEQSGERETSLQLRFLLELE